MKRALSLLLCLLLSSKALAQELLRQSVSPTQPRYGAMCDGITDDTAAFAKAIDSGRSLELPPNVECVVAGITLPSHTSLSCNGSTLKPPVSAAGKWILKRTGAYQKLKSCTLQDQHSYTMASTMLNSEASPGATILNVDVSTHFAVGMPITAQLDSGIRFVTKIVAVTAGQITILDPIPSSATAVSLVAGGTGAVNEDSLVALGGSGLNAPLTIQASVASGGALKSATIQAPGLYETPPPNPVSFQNTSSARGASAMLDVIWAGASKGNTIQAAWGLLVSEGAIEGSVEDLRIAYAPVGIVYQKGESQSEGEQLSNFQMNVVSLVGLFVDVNTNTLSVSNGRIWGIHPRHCAVGVYLNGRNPGSIAAGGNNFVNVNALHCNVGWMLRAAQLSMFTQATSDTNTHYAWILDQSSNLGFDNVYGGVTGLGVNGYGIGMHIGGGSLNVGISQLQAGRNAADLNVDGTSSVFLGQTVGVQSVGHRITGNGAGLFSGAQTLSANTGPILLSPKPTYIGPNGSSAAETNVMWRNGLCTSTITRVQIFSSVSPGQDTWTATLRINGTDTPMTCSYSGGDSFGCEMTANMQTVNPGDMISLKLVSSGTASGIVWATVRQQN